MKENLLTVARAASYLGCSRWQLARLCAARKVKFSYVGSRRKFRPEDLDIYLEKQAIFPKSDNSDRPAGESQVM